MLRFKFSIKLCWTAFSALFLHLLHLSYSGPISYKKDGINSDVGNNSLVIGGIEPEHSHLTKIRVGVRGGCRYQASLYSSGDLVPIEEPCLNCQCKNTAVVCKLRICSSEAQIPPPGCILVHKAKKCCPQIVCPENTNVKKISREHRSDLSNHTINSLAHPEDKGFCIHDGTLYAEGSAMRASSLCEHCFCIRGQMKCSSPQCVIPLDGCKPKFRSYACCPTNYDCHEANSTSIIKTTPSSTPIPSFLKGCQVAGKFVREGEPVLPLSLEPDLQHINPCQTCYCMGGIIRCRPLECDKPIHGCIPIIKLGHCCPDRYECQTNSTIINHVIHAEKNVLGSLSTTPLSSSTQQPTVSQESSFSPIILSQVNMNEIHTSRAANNLHVLEILDTENKEHHNENDSTINAANTFKSNISSDTGSREERRRKEMESKLSNEEYSLVPRSDEDLGIVIESSAHKTEEPEQTTVIPVIQIETTTQPTEVTTAQNHDEISELLSIASKNHQDESDGEELTIAIEVVTENELPAMTTTETTTVPSYLSNNTKFTAEAELQTNSSTSENQTLDSYLGDGDVGDDEDSSQLENSVLTNIHTNLDSTSTSPLDATSPSSTSPSNIANPSSGEKSNNKELMDRVENSTEDGEETSTKITGIEFNSSSSTEESLSHISSESEGSFKNPLQFIPFGVEDALILDDPNDIPHLPQAPIKITFDNTDASKANLIGRDPSKVYVHVPLLNNQNDEDDEFARIITPADNNNNDKDSKQDSFDVPVSASLYNNGFFPSRIPPKFQNKSIFDRVFEDSRLEDDEDDEAEAAAAELMEISNKTQHFQNMSSDNLQDSFDYDDSNLETHAKNLSISIKNNDTLTSNKILNNTLSDTNSTQSSIPNRIYSKFDIHDSPYYHRFGESGYDLTSLAAIAAAKKNGVQIDHHRYYEGPEITKDTIGSFYPFADYVIDEDTRNDDDEQLLYEEELNNNSNERHEPISFSSQLEKLSRIPVSSSSSPTSLPITKGSTNIPFKIPTNNKPTYQLASSVKLTTEKVSSPHLESSTLLFSPSNGTGGFKPVVSYPFIPFPKNKPLDALLHIGLKLSGCNIYGKMYGIGNIIRELSSNCVQCQCTEIGVQCSEIHCEYEDDLLS